VSAGSFITPGHYKVLIAVVLNPGSVQIGGRGGFPNRWHYKLVGSGGPTYQLAFALPLRVGLQEGGEISVQEDSHVRTGIDIHIRDAQRATSVKILNSNVGQNSKF
jgi:hypothetical protein